MKTSRPLFLLIPLSLLVVVVLTLYLQDFVQSEVAGPLTNAIGITVRLIRSIPESLDWTFVLVIAIIVVIRSFNAHQEPAIDQVDPILNRTKRERVDFWIIQLQHTHGDYGHLRLTDFLGKLILEVIAHREQLIQPEVERRVENRELIVPEEIRAYLSNMRRRTYAKKVGYITMLWKRLISSLELDINRLSQTSQSGKESENINKPVPNQGNQFAEMESVLDFLEEQLKIQYP